MSAPTCCNKVRAGRPQAAPTALIATAWRRLTSSSSFPFLASFALNLASSSTSSDFEEILANRLDLIDFEDEGEGARFLFPISNEDAALRLAAETAALADKFGFVVIEESRGWTAIEPLPEPWDSFPGAHRRWSANTTCNEDECDGQPVFEINSIDVTDQH